MATTATSSGSVPELFRRFDSDSPILYIVIPTRTQELLHCTLYWKAHCGQARSWDIDEQLTPLGATTCRLDGSSDAVGTGEECGEGDSTSCLLKSGLKWPVLVIYFETINELREDMRWWFRASDPRCQDCRIGKVRSPEGTHSAGELGRGCGTPEWYHDTKTSCRADSKWHLRTSLRQSITITGDGGTTDPFDDTYHVTSGALVLDFELLLLRQPVPPEGDFIISTEDLQDYGRSVFTVARV
ncbi:hypothetical protein V8F33_001555 [Rhypophila sp. PSN 637]